MEVRDVVQTSRKQWITEQVLKRCLAYSLGIQFNSHNLFSSFGFIPAGVSKTALG